jgi:hypothetical protein
MTLTMTDEMLHVAEFSIVNSKNELSFIKAASSRQLLFAIHLDDSSGRFLEELLMSRAGSLDSTRVSTDAISHFCSTDRVTMTRGRRNFERKH